VLVAEDNKVNQLVVAGHLRRLGCEPVCVDGGLPALARVQSETFDLILMDCDMPDLDGFATTRRIREWETQQQQPRIPIVALTAHILDDAKAHCFSAGMDDYLSKPIQGEQLREKLQHWTQNPELSPMTP
jgi:CheY-like chemotaxis protein